NRLSGGGQSMYINGGTNLIVDSNEITNTGYYAFYITNSNGIKISANHITINGIYGFYVTYASTSASSETIEIDHNVVDTVPGYANGYPMYLMYLNGMAAKRGSMS